MFVNKKKVVKKSDATDNLIGKLNCVAKKYESRYYCVW